jgi:hypothetical protein
MYAREFAGGAVIEAPFSLIQEEMEMDFWDAVIAGQMAFSLIPDAVDAVDVIALDGEACE